MEVKGTTATQVKGTTAVVRLSILRLSPRGLRQLLQEVHCYTRELAALSLSPATICAQVARATPPMKRVGTPSGSRQENSCRKGRGRLNN